MKNVNQVSLVRRQQRGEKIRVSLGVRTCELFLCFVAIVRVRAIVLTSLFSLFYVTGEFHRFIHRGRAENASKALNAIPGIVTKLIPQKGEQSLASLKESNASSILHFLTGKELVLSSCTGSHEPLQRTKQYTTANQ